MKKIKNISVKIIASFLVISVACVTVYTCSAAVNDNDLADSIHYSECE